VEDFVGRRWNRANSNLIWIIPAGSWVIAGCGDDLSPLRDKYLQQLKAQGRPVPVLKENWLEADADWGRLTTWLPDWARLVKPAHLEVSVTVVTNHLRMTAHIVYPEAISWRLEPWNIPTNLIQSPLDSLTAAQDIAAILNPSPTLTRVCGTLLTNQFYAWAMGEMPLQTYVAWPVANASNVLAELSTEAPAAFNADMEKLNGADLVWQPEFNRLYLPKLGIGSPDLSAAEDHGQQFLLSTLFPLSPVGKPAPDQLLKQIIGRTNLVYFDREVTGPRLQEWRMLGDILFHRLGVRPREIGIAKGFEAKWLDGLRPLAGNTSTEITRVAPNELLAVRNSPVGLTGIEIYLFSEWLSAAGYYPTNAPPSAH
jgi:hypothetical protein